MDYKKQIGQKIKHYRTGLKLTLEDLSERADLSVSFLGEIERGRKVCSINTLAKIAEKLNTTLADLFDFTKEKPIDDSIYRKEIQQLIKPLKKGDADFMIDLIRKMVKKIIK